MSREKDEALFKKYPDLFEYAFQTEDQINEQQYFYPIKFGMEIEDAWYPVVEEALENIKDSGAKVIQIKQKLGGLRMSVSNLPERYRKFITEAEEKCSRICEVCGAAGIIMNLNGYYTVRCEDHSK